MERFEEVLRTDATDKTDFRQSNPRLSVTSASSAFHFVMKHT